MFIHLPVASLLGTHLVPAHHYLEGNKKKGRYLSYSSAKLEQLLWSHWLPQTKFPPWREGKGSPLNYSWVAEHQCHQHRSWVTSRDCCGEDNGHNGGHVLAAAWQWWPLFWNTPQVRTWHPLKRIGHRLLSTWSPHWRFQGLNSLLMLARTELLEWNELTCALAQVQHRAETGSPSTARPQRRAGSRGCSISELLSLKC